MSTDNWPQEPDASVDVGEVAPPVILKPPSPANRIFAIGDLHGCTRELYPLLRFLEVDLKVDDDDLIVFLGDYIDRGPNSKGIVDELIDWKLRHQQTLFLKGNHEDMLDLYLRDIEGADQQFLINGGVQFLNSYGFSSGRPVSEVLRDLPESHQDFFHSLVHAVLVEDLLFVHAGVNPGLPLESQSAFDMLWIREEFIYGRHQLGLTVVFGHTPFEEVFQQLPQKLGLDTGLIYGNKLTCVEIRSLTAHQVTKGHTVVHSSGLRKE